MKKLLLTLLITTLSLTGCATFMENGEPTETMILVEAGSLALLFYETKEEEYPDKEALGLAAVQEANKYLLFMYGTGPLGQQPKYTLPKLLHTQVLSEVQDVRLRKLAYTARLMVDKDGTLTGLSWGDALLLGEGVANEIPTQ